MKNVDLQTRFSRATVIVAFTGGWILGVYLIDAYLDPSPPKERLLYATILIAPFLGAMVPKVASFIYETAVGWFLSGRREEPPAIIHSTGEALLKGARYPEALEWFTETVQSNSEDWKARSRIIDIFENHIEDTERLIEERNQLLKMKEAPEGIWTQTAMNLGQHWEDAERPDRAINVYKMYLWRYPEGEGAAEVKVRLANLEAQASDI